LRNDTYTNTLQQSKSASLAAECQCWELPIASNIWLFVYWLRASPTLFAEQFREVYYNEGRAYSSLMWRHLSNSPVSCGIPPRRICQGPIQWCTLSVACCPLQSWQHSVTRHSRFRPRSFLSIAFQEVHLLRTQNVSKWSPANRSLHMWSRMMPTGRSIQRIAAQFILRVMIPPQPYRLIIRSRPLMPAYSHFNSLSIRFRIQYLLTAGSSSPMQPIRWAVAVVFSSIRLPYSQLLCRRLALHHYPFWGSRFSSLATASSSTRLNAETLLRLNRLAFRRYLEAIDNGINGGAYERQAV